MARLTTKIAQRLLMTKTWMENKWMTTHPKSLKAFVLFKNGLTVSLADLKEYAAVRVRCFQQPTSISYDELTRRQLYLMRIISSDLSRTLPAVVIGLMPGGVFFIPFFLLFPQHFLTRAFWSETQTAMFDSKAIGKRAGLAPQLMTCTLLQLTLLPSSLPLSSASSVTSYLAGFLQSYTLFRSPRLHSRRAEAGVVDEEVYQRQADQLKRVLAKINAGNIVTTDDLFAIETLFMDRLDLPNLAPDYIAKLCLLHGVTRISPPLVRLTAGWHVSRLERRSCLLRTEDRHLASELRPFVRRLASLCQTGQAANTGTEAGSRSAKAEAIAMRHLAVPRHELIELCISRGINAHRMSLANMATCLESWSRASLQIAASNHSLRMHLPLLLSFNLTAKYESSK